MNLFKNFLSEYIEDKASIIDVCNETIISFDDNDNMIFENSLECESDDDFYTSDNLDAIFCEENEQVLESDINSNKSWGGENIINLDFDDTLSEGKNGLTPTEKRLMGQKTRTHDEIKDDALQYIASKKDDGSYEITVKKYGSDEERHKITPEEIDEILQRKNKTPEVKTVNSEFTDNSELKKNGKFISSNNKKKFIQQLNKIAERILGKGEVHYKWEPNPDDNSKFTNRILVNTTQWDDSDELDPYRFDSAEYKIVDTADEKEQILNLLDDATKKVQSNSKNKNKYGYDSEIGIFTINGRPMNDNELKKFIARLNGGVKDAESSYWNHFKITMKGSKVGDIANFSLPPIETCNKDSPCITDGCYAVKAYGMYPASRVAMDINLSLLRQGRFEQFEHEIGMALDKVYKKSVGAMKEGGKINYFRFHVSGDIFSPEYFKSICRIAKQHPDIGFWTYTKQYGILDKCKGDIPENLSVLVSCWGKFRPKYWMNGKYANLENEFTLAYLDDGTEDTETYIDGNSSKGYEPFTCPCTDYSEQEVHCNKCLRCYETVTLKNNLKFKKH